MVGPKGEEIYTDEYGRVKVQFHWDREGKRDEKSSCWIRVGQIWAGAGWGGMFIPRIGQEVIVDFLEGDPDNPIVTGRVYHATNTTPYPLPADKTKSTIKSDSSPGGGGSNELRFEDAKGDEEVYLHAQKDWSIAVENDKNQAVGHDESLYVSNNRTKTVGADETITVDKNRTITVANGDDGLTVAKGHRTVKVDLGNHELTVGTGSKTDVIQGPYEITVKSGYFKVTCGASQLVLHHNGNIEISGNVVAVSGAQSVDISGNSITSEAAMDHNTRGVHRHFRRFREQYRAGRGSHAESLESNAVSICTTCFCISRALTLRLTKIVSGKNDAGRPIFSVLVKTSYRIEKGALTKEEMATPFVLADEYHGQGDPLSSTVRMESELAPFKPFTDVVVAGKAYTPGAKKTRQMDISAKIGGRKKTIRVIGDRQCVYNGNSKPSFTDPVEFSEMEIRYERAYGGMDAASDPDLPFAYPRNPMGRGLALKNVREAIDGLALPNFEDPVDLLTPERVVLGKPENWNRQPHSPRHRLVSEKLVPEVFLCGRYARLRDSRRAYERGKAWHRAEKPSRTPFENEIAEFRREVQQRGLHRAFPAPCAAQGKDRVAQHESRGEDEIQTAQNIPSHHAGYRPGGKRTGNVSAYGLDPAGNLPGGPDMAGRSRISRPPLASGNEKNARGGLLK